jgi:hypothetical protein
MMIISLLLDPECNNILIFMFDKIKNKKKMNKVE